MRDDLWQTLKAACEENGWKTLDGLPFILAIGLTALREVQLCDQPGEQTSEDLEAVVELLTRERMEIEGRDAVLNYRAYKFLQDAKTLSIKLKACRTELAQVQRAYQERRQKSEGQS